jgi:hypothetical protein
MMVSFTSETTARFGGCATGTRPVADALESAHTTDWDEAQKRMRERLAARDNRTVDAVRKGQQLTFDEWADFLSGELLQAANAPPTLAPG